MLPEMRPSPGLARLAGLALFAISPGCGVDRAGTEVEVTPPSGWRKVDPAEVPVPGTPLSAWRGPESGSIVVYRTLPAPGATATSIAVELANRTVNLPGVRDVSRRAVKAPAFGPAGDRTDPVDAAFVEYVAPGTGDAIAPSGMGKAVAPTGKALVETRRGCLSYPRPDGTFWVCWHYPEADRERMAPLFDFGRDGPFRVRFRRLPSSSK